MDNFPFQLGSFQASFQAIATVESPFKEKFGTPRQPGLVANTVGHIHLRENLNPDAFQGLADYSHAWLIFVFHDNDSFKTGKPFTKTKVHPPRLEGAAVGVFATRSPHRPNAIGLSLVKIESINGRTLTVSGLDLIEGTPILDIKPYLPSVESKPEAREGWSGKAKPTSFSITWSEAAKIDLARLTQKLPEKARSELALAIEGILRLDPRPVAYRGTPENPDPYMSRYGFRFQTWNVVFEMLAGPGATEEGAHRIAQIAAIEEWPQ